MDTTSTSTSNNGDTFHNLVMILADVHGDEQPRWEAAQALGTLGDRQALEPLIIALSGESGAVRSAASLVLGDLEDGRVADSLLEVLRRPDEHEGVTQIAGLALADLDVIRALPILIEAFHNEKEDFYSAVLHRQRDW